MIRKIVRLATAKWRTIIFELSIPSPPFKASKRCATIMYGVWYGRMTPEQARQKAREWGFRDDDINRMLVDATAAPSYWSRNIPIDAEPNRDRTNG